MTGNEVFHRLRVAEGVRTQTVYNGVSANSWLSPAGITKSRHQHNQPTRTASPLPEMCRKTLSDRAKSANAMLGRRHFEVPRQGISKDETLNGRRMATNGDSEDLVTEGRRLIQRPKTTGGMNDRRAGFFETTRCRQQARPHTSIGTYRSSYRTLSAREPHLRSHRSDLEEFPQLRITQLFSSQKVAPLDVQIPSNAASHGHNVKTGNDVSSDSEPVIGFQSVAAMREAYYARVKSPNMFNPRTPTTPDVFDYNTRTSDLLNNTQTKYIPDQDERSITPRNRFATTKTSTGGNKRFVTCGLRPLFFSRDSGEPDDETHQCPSGCKGCFRACLAPEKFVDSTSQKDECAEQGRLKKKNFEHRPSPRRMRIVKRELPEASQRCITVSKGNCDISIWESVS